MTTIELLLLVAAFILALAMTIPVYRMIVGPTILDRAVALDMLLVLVVMGLGIYAGYTASTFSVIPALALTATGFIGTLAIARFVGRDDQSSSEPPKPGAKLAVHDAKIENDSRNKQSKKYSQIFSDSTNPPSTDDQINREVK